MSVVIWPAGFCRERNSQRRPIDFIEKEYCGVLTYWLLRLDAVDDGGHWLWGLDLLLGDWLGRHLELSLHEMFYSCPSVFIGTTTGP